MVVSEVVLEVVVLEMVVLEAVLEVVLEEVLLVVKREEDRNIGGDNKEQRKCIVLL